MRSEKDIDYSADLERRIERLNMDLDRLIEALEPLAYQDCDSWGCDLDDDEHDCPPENARKLLRRMGVIA
jgi:hypothetical protein